MSAKTNCKIQIVQTWATDLALDLAAGCSVKWASQNREWNSAYECKDKVWIL